MCDKEKDINISAANKEEDCSGSENVKGIQTSVRLRIKSGNNRKPEFIYDEPVVVSRHKKTNLFDYQFKSVSCSNLSNLTAGSHVVKKGKQNKSTSKRCEVVNALPPVNASDSSLNTKPTGHQWQEKQAKLSQQRLDLLLSREITDQTDQENSLCRVATQLDLSHLGSQSSIAESFVSTSEYLNPREGALNNSIATPQQLQQHQLHSPRNKEATEAMNPNEIEKLNTKAGEGSGEPNVGTAAVTGLDDNLRNFLLQMQADINANTTTTVNRIKDELKQEFTRGLDEIKNEQVQLKTSITQANTEVSTVKSSMARLEGDLINCKDKLNSAVGVIIKQNQMLKECKEQNGRMEKYLYRDMIRLYGLKVTEEEDLAKAVQTFFTSKMQIEKIAL